MKIKANKILKNDYDAEDCVHNTVVVIIDKLERFKLANDEDNLKWLISVACRNVAIDMYRKKKKQNENMFSMTQYDVEDEEDDIIDIPDETYNAENIVLSEESFQYLMGLVNKLDDIYRDVILLKYNGWDNKDIAEITFVTPDIVRQRLHRAKLKIIEMGGELYGSYKK